MILLHLCVQFICIWKEKKELVDKVAFNVLSGDKDLQNICTNQSEYPISVQQLQKP